MFYLLKENLGVPRFVLHQRGNQMFPVDDMGLL